MPSRPNSFERLAQDAADRLDQARAQGQQLSLLGDSEPQAVADGQSGGRAVRGKGKALAQMRDWLASRGYATPQEQLARMAGLSGGDDPILEAMTKAERLKTWAFAGTQRLDKNGNPMLDDDGQPLPMQPTPSQRLHAFEVAYTMQFRASDALAPYIAAKVGPDGPQAPTVQINLPAMPATPAPAADPAAVARDVTPVSDRRMRSASVTIEHQPNQGVSAGPSGQSDGASRTERASD